MSHAGIACGRLMCLCRPAANEASICSAACGLVCINTPTCTAEEPKGLKCHMLGRTCSNTVHLSEGAITLGIWVQLVLTYKALLDRFWHTLI